jgi:cytochrome c556
MKTIRARAVGSLGFMLAAASIAVGAARLGGAQQSGADAVALQTSINAVMVALVDHAAHEIWEAASAQTLTGRDWQTVEQHAFQLVAAGALVTLEGTGSQDKAWVATPAWKDWAGKLTEGGLAALDAAQKSDQRALRAAGETLVDTCFGCHDAFKPDAPTEGLLHVPHYED